MARLGASLERLREKEAEFASAEKLREYGDIIMANIAAIKSGDAWLEAENFYAEPGSIIRIKLEPRKSPAAQGELYYEQYRKAKNGLADIKAELAAGEGELATLEQTLGRLLEETNPLALHKLLRNKGEKPVAKADSKRPGLSFRRKDWLIIVGRDAAENDELLRRHVKGNDLWLHARDFPGSYVFIKQRSGKTVPLDILLDAGNLAIFYSKGRNNGEGDLFYTPVKFLRRAKNGPKGLVIPTQEKNLHVRVEEGRLKELEQCRIEKQ
jgi:predicted ribosome quality control (RQC) complex YloA/Tae2 family protein